RPAQRWRHQNPSPSTTIENSEMNEATSTIIPLVVDNVPPLIFIEARLVGTTSNALISQLGLSMDAAECSVAFMTRTSGLLLVTGAGSYAIYRFCTRLLGNRFVSVLVDGSHCNQLSAADRRLLYPSDPIREENEDESEETRQEKEEEGDTVSESEWKSRVSKSRTPSEFSMSRVRRSMRARGLFSIGSRRDTRSGVIRREGAAGELSPSGSIDRPDLIPSGVNPRIRQISGSSLGPSRNGPHSSSSRCSDASASLNIVWENNQQQWEDEFADGQNGLAPSPSMGDLCSIFDDVMSMRSGYSAVPSRMGEERSRNDFGSIDLSGIACRFDCPSTSAASVTGPPIDDLDDIRLHEIPCMRDSSYMYRSVVVAGSEFGDSDVMSTTSRMSSRFRRENVKSNGLWNLTSTPSNDDQQPSTSSGPSSEGKKRTGEKGRRSRMEMSHDSGLAMMKSQSSKAASSTGKRSTTMFDSAIDDADLSISGDSENDVIVEESFSHRDDSSTPRRQNRQSTSSMSIAPSTMSLEWDDGEEGIPRMEKRREMALSLPMERPSIGSWSPSDSRDLMVFAKERFTPKSGQLKALADLYSRRRFRRLGSLHSSSDLHSLLLSSIYHQVPLHRSTPDATLKRLRRCFSNYNCLKGWRMEEAFDVLERLRSTALKNCAPDSSSSSEAVKGMRLLMALTVCEVFEKKMAGSRSEDWLTVERPDDAIDRINTKECFDEMEWRLVAETFSIRIERFFFRTPVGAPASLSSSILTPKWE
ncbi:hypothetical protein PENTCL1PPCAC_2112, partial [Pristionchus entomophagus]